MIDLKRIERLCAIASNGSTHTVGAAAPTSDICAHDGLASAFPGLVEASGLIGSDQIQSRSSWGGNLANASPAADTPPSLIVNDARAVIAGPAGERTVPAAEVATGPGQTSLSEGEIIVEFELDEPPERTSDAYLRLIPRTEMDIAVVGAAARVTLDADGNVAAAAVALGAVAPTVVRVPDAEAALIGRAPSDEALAAVESAAAAATNPIDDKRGTVEYRRQVAGRAGQARRAGIAADRARNQGGHSDEPHVHVTCTINGESAEFLCDTGESLLDALRDEIAPHGGQGGLRYRRLRGLLHPHGRTCCSARA